MDSDEIAGELVLPRCRAGLVSTDQAAPEVAVLQRSPAGKPGRASRRPAP